MSKVLMVSGDHATRSAIQKTLSFNGFVVHTAPESTTSWKFLQEIRFDFIMIDMKLKNESGLAFYKSLRQSGNNIPVMMVGEGELDELVLKDLSKKNYDYMLKPLKFNDLRTKINNFLIKTDLTEDFVSFGDIKIDKRQQLLIFRNKLLQLSRIELDILILLAQKSGEKISISKLAKFFEKEGGSAIYYIGGLRKKLKNCGMEALEICFVKDQGLKLSY